MNRDSSIIAQCRSISIIADQFLFKLIGIDRHWAMIEEDLMNVRYKDEYQGMIYAQMPSCMIINGVFELHNSSFKYFLMGGSGHWIHFYITLSDSAHRTVSGPQCTLSLLVYEGNKEFSTGLHNIMNKGCFESSIFMCILNSFCL